MGTQPLEGEIVEPVGANEKAIVIGLPMGKDRFAELESHLLSQSPGRFIVIAAPGNVMGDAPYRIPENQEYYRVGFARSNDTDVVIPRSDRLKNTAEHANLRIYYEGLRAASRYKAHGGGFTVDSSGQLTFAKKDGLTSIVHSFPVGFPPVSVNGSHIAGGDRFPLERIAAIRIGDDIKIIYANNTQGR